MHGDEVPEVIMDKLKLDIYARGLPKALHSRNLLELLVNLYMTPTADWALLYHIARKKGASSHFLQTAVAVGRALGRAHLEVHPGNESSTANSCDLV